MALQVIHRKGAIHGMMLAFFQGKNPEPGEFMTQSLLTSKMSPVGTEIREAFEASGETAADRDPARTLAHEAPGSIAPASAWDDALCCEARNALQVVLSGAEILLEDHVGNLLSGQKELIAKMTDNAYHLADLLATLLSPDQFKLDVAGAGLFQGSRRVPAKV